jgi:hypothetical protein
LPIFAVLVHPAIPIPGVVVPTVFLVATLIGRHAATIVGRRRIVAFLASCEQGENCDSSN